MFTPYALRMSALAALMIPLLATQSDAAVFATYDATQHNTNGFAFGDLDDFFAVDNSVASSASTSIRISIWRMGSSVGGFRHRGRFQPCHYTTGSLLTVDPLNVASNFRIVLVDNDGPNTGEEYQFYFDLTSLTPGQPAVISQSLINPGPVYRQAVGGQTDGDMIQNYGLRQMQIQSEFGGTNRLKIDVQSVKLIDPENPLLIEFNTATYKRNADVQLWDFLRSGRARCFRSHFPDQCCTGPVPVGLTEALASMA